LTLKLFGRTRDLGMAKGKKQSQALAIKLSRDRRAGKNVPPPPKGRYSERTRQRAKRDLEIGQRRKRAKRGAAAKRMRSR
jgi:hypothetical protein